MPDTNKTIWAVIGVTKNGLEYFIADIGMQASMITFNEEEAMEVLWPRAIGFSATTNSATFKLCRFDATETVIRSVRNGRQVTR